MKRKEDQRQRQQKSRAQRTKDHSTHSSKHKRKIDKISRQHHADRIRDMFDESVLQCRKKALSHLHRSADPTDKKHHKMHVCIICDCFIIGQEKIHSVNDDTLRKCRNGLSVDAYEAYYGMKLHPNVIKEYHVEGLDGLLLSPRSRIMRTQRTSNGHSCCTSCFNSIKTSIKDKKGASFQGAISD
jgi:hypothetical protein